MPSGLRLHPFPTPAGAAGDAVLALKADSAREPVELMGSRPEQSDRFEGFGRGPVFLLIAILAGVLNLGLLSTITMNREIISELQQELAVGSADAASAVHEFQPSPPVPMPALNTCADELELEVPSCDPLSHIVARPSA